jgi:hypothetical protein
MTPSHTNTDSYCKDPFTCSECVSKIEDAAIQSALNMGVPDWFGCPECGGTFKTSDDFINHLSDALMTIGKCVNANS